MAEAEPGGDLDPGQADPSEGGGFSAAEPDLGFGSYGQTTNAERAAWGDISLGKAAGYAPGILGYAANAITGSPIGNVLGLIGKALLDPQSIGPLDLMGMGAIPGIAKTGLGLIDKGLGAMGLGYKGGPTTAEMDRGYGSHGAPGNQQSGSSQLMQTAMNQLSQQYNPFVGS